MQERWDSMQAPDHAATIAKMNALGTTAAGAAQPAGIGENALRQVKIGPTGETAHERHDHTEFNPQTVQWRYGPIESRRHLH